MTLNPEKALDRLGQGGAQEVLAVVCVVLTLTVIYLWRRTIQLTDRNDALNDKMLEIVRSMAKENAELIVATNTTLTAATDALGANVSRGGRR